MAGYTTPAWTNDAAPAIDASALTALGQAVETAEHPYGVCSTAAGTAAKTVTIDVSRTLELFAGLTVRVKFSNANTASAPTLNVNGTGAKALAAVGTASVENAWAAGDVVNCTYDGTNWVITSCLAAVAETEAELAGGMAILSDGDTHVAITSGQYVYVRNHSTLADGLYKATANIAANGALSSSNVTAVSGGGLNDVKTSYYDTVSSGTSKTITLSPAVSVWLLACGNPGNNDLLGAWVVVPGTTLGTGQARKLGGTSYLTVSVSREEVTLSNSSSATLRIGLVKMA